jgi:hypothetical protein
MRPKTARLSGPWLLLLVLQVTASCRSLVWSHYPTRTCAPLSWLVSPTRKIYFFICIRNTLISLTDAIFLGLQAKRARDDDEVAVVSACVLA